MGRGRGIAYEETWFRDGFDGSTVKFHKNDSVLA